MSLSRAVAAVAPLLLLAAPAGAAARQPGPQVVTSHRAVAGPALAG